MLAHLGKCDLDHPVNIGARALQELLENHRSPWTHHDPIPLHGRCHQTQYHDGDCVST
jgi:hypothetical protein